MRTNVKFLVKLFSKSLQGVGQRPTTLTLVGGSQRETRETAKRFSRTAAQLPSQSRLPPCQRLASAAVCTQAGLFFRLHVHIQLGVGDGDALPIEGSLHVLLHLIIDGPVVVRVAPDLAHQGDRAVLSSPTAMRGAGSWNTRSSASTKSWSSCLAFRKSAW